MTLAPWLPKAETTTWPDNPNDRLVRMYQNEWMNGNEAFTAVELLQMLHQSIFRKTIAGLKLNVMERSLQKSFVDALITAAAENEGVKINKSIAEERQVASSGSRTIDMTMTQITRTSDALSVKRAELLNIMKLMKSRANSGDLSTQMHYDDVVLRIQTALGLQK